MMHPYNVQATLEKDTSTDTVCCLIQPSFSRRADLLEYIMSIADKYVQYRFVVCQLQQHSRMPSLLGHRAGSPDTGTNMCISCIFMLMSFRMK